MKKYYAVIPDIHGCLKQLVSALSSIDARDDVEQVIFLGDYVDRGPHSKEVLDILISRPKNKNTFILGNHDDMFLDWLKGNRDGRWEFMFGEKTLDSFGPLLDTQQWPGALDKYQEFLLDTCQLFMQTDHHIFVHAGINPLKSMLEQERDYMLWGREMFCYSNLNKTVITGHSIVPEVTLRNNHLALDIGCYYKGGLAVALIPTNEMLTWDNSKYEIFN